MPQVATGNIRALLVAGILSAACGGAASGAPATAPGPGPDAPPAAEPSARQEGAVPCGSIPLGMTFGYQIRRGADGRPAMDVTAYPVVGTVCPRGPAEASGVAVGDVILEVNGTDARERAARDALRVAPGGSVVIRLRRGDAEREVTLRVPPRPTPSPERAR